MMTKINLEYFGMPGSGATVKEAKADAGARLEAAMKGDYAPVLVRYRGTIAVMSRNPQQWGYRFLHTDAVVVRVDHCSIEGNDREECLYRMLKHIADVERMDSDTEPPADLFAALPMRLKLAAINDWHSRTAWVKECATARAAGKTYVGGTWV